MVRGACLQGAGLAALEQQQPVFPKGRDLRVLYKMGICSVESLCLLRTPMSRGLPLLQGQEQVELAIMSTPRVGWVSSEH